jgi:hypothetical protein
MKSQSMKLGAMVAGLLLSIVLGTVGCDSNSNSFVATQSNNGQPVTPAPPAQIGPGPGPAIPNPGFGNILINFQLARALPSNATSLEFTGLSAGNFVVFTATSARQSQVSLLDVPASVTNLQFDVISNGSLIGQGSIPIQLAPGQTLTIDNPDFQDVTGPPLPLAGTYFVSGAEPTASSPGAVQGQLTMTGDGTVSGGTLTLASAGGGADTTFNVSGGNVAMAADRRFTGTLNATPFDLTINGQGSLSGPLSATATGGTGVTAVAMMIHLQKTTANISAASLNGTYTFAAAHVGTTRTGFSNGEVELNGAGGVTGGTLTHVDLGELTITGGNYTAAGNGAVALTLNLSGGTSLSLNGSIGATGVLALAGPGATGEAAFLLATRTPATSCGPADLGTNPRSVGMVINQSVYYSDLAINPQGSVNSGTVTVFDKSSADPSENIVNSGTFAFNSACTIIGNLTLTPQGAPTTIPLSLTKGFGTSDKRTGIGTGDNGQVGATQIRAFSIANKT